MEEQPAGDAAVPRSQAAERWEQLSSEEQALAAQLQALYPDLARWAQSLIGSRDAEDVCQDALLRFWRRRQERTEPADGAAKVDLRTQLYSIVRSIAKERFRLSKSRGDVVGRWAGGVTAHHATHVSSPLISSARLWMNPERLLEAPAWEPHISAALEAVTATQREVVTLLYMHGLSNAEAAAVLSIEAVSVRTHLFHACKRMREPLAPWGAEHTRGAKSSARSANTSRAAKEGSS
jgi:RNA polymerase sigma factor (sigma-70 family)